MPAADQFKYWWVWLAVLGWITSLALVTAILILGVEGRDSNGSLIATVGESVIMIGWLSFTTSGAILAWHRRENLVGWLLLSSGLFWLAGMTSERYLQLPGSPPGAAVIASIMDSVAWVMGLGTIALALLLFPEGRFASRRWQVAGWVIILSATVLAVALLVTPGPVTSFPQHVNPFGIGATSHLSAWIGDAARIAFFVGFWSALVSVGVRYWHSRGIARQQMKWMAAGVAAMATAFLLGGVAEFVGLNESVFNAVALMLLPPAATVAVLRYRLWDLDLVIRDAVAYTLLALVITSVYLGAVIASGWIAGGGNRDSVLLAILATAIAAVLLQPVRVAAQDLARSLVFRQAPVTADQVPPIRIRTLGSFRLERGGVPVGRGEWKSRKARQLLKMLVASRGRPVHREQLIDALWPGESGSNLGNRLAVAASTVRATLDPGKEHPPDHFISGDDQTLRLNLDTLDVDVEQFLEHARDVVGPERDRSSIEQAIELYRGEFLPEDLYEDWSTPLREETRLAYLAILRGKAVSAPSIDDALRAYSNVLEIDPWDEPSHKAIIHLLRSSGRHGEASRARERYRVRMLELGLEPDQHQVPLNEY